MVLNRYVFLFGFHLTIVGKFVKEKENQAGPRTAEMCRELALMSGIPAGYGLCQMKAAEQVVGADER